MKLRESLMSSVVSEKPNVKWDDVAGLGPAKEELQEAIIFPLRFPHMFQGKRKARRAILLYGPPGTGKSYLAKAVATEVEHTLFSISSGDVMSKWYGDSEGLVRQLFELAREKKPAIIFIDEIDALCSNRDGGPGGGNEDTARMKTEFLVQMDGVGKDNSGILVLAATNLPWSLDPALRRRFQKRIHIPLPDEDARKQLFKIHLGDLGKNVREKDVEELARRSDGLSGSDIANAIQDGLMVPVKKVHIATHFRKVQHNGFQWYTPCDKSDPFGMPMTWKKVPPNKLKEPALTTEDLLGVLKNVKSSVADHEIQKYHEWTEQFGLEGA
ncbi:P-loop containing nucleoside triphosphate hydrolase protein [Podospora didyma]|uniref:P-loop containing nucleoside triphosphate hydrolase protein n=1 Tax=Podospora didyma TaxID=330526 RepID=A0AAE0KKG1_9PEZI|nr:P-loop containing nucleoside triphosphate hydrolase protein [Podospora didyma]